MKLPITVILAVKNEAANLSRCLEALGFAQKVYVVDSKSTDQSGQICRAFRAEVVQFRHQGGYPKKRQWAMDHLMIKTPWILLLDADELVTPALQEEISGALGAADSADAFLIQKQFHFLGRRFRFGGFSHSAVLLFKKGRARFERLIENDPSGLDMEVHERLLVQGRIGKLGEPLWHEDFKGLQAYLERHEKYSTWEAELRHQFLATGIYGSDSVPARFWGDTQQRRRFFKRLVIKMPFEPVIWFIYHYVIRLGFLEGQAGLVACRIRAAYIRQTRAKLKELTQTGASQL